MFLSVDRLTTPPAAVRVAGRWVFPADLQAPVLTPCPAVYNLVLDTARAEPGVLRHLPPPPLGGRHIFFAKPFPLIRILPAKVLCRVRFCAFLLTFLLKMGHGVKTQMQTKVGMLHRFAPRNGTPRRFYVSKELCHRFHLTWSCLGGLPTPSQGHRAPPPPPPRHSALDPGHVVVVGGVECVTLGHGLAEAGVRHPFFGTRCVVDCLRSMAGWGRGEVLVGQAGAPVRRTCPACSGAGLWG